LDPKPSTSPRKRGQQAKNSAPKRRDYSHLPVRQKTIVLPEDERQCPVCGEPFAEMSDAEVCEQIEIEVSAYRQQLIRKRYRSRCHCAGCPRTVTAPTPAKLIPKGLFGISVWVEILLDKYHGHCSTGRLIERLRLLGLDLAPGTIASGLQVIEPMFTPIYEALVARQGDSYYLQADETRWSVFIEQQGKSGHRWWLWLFIGEDTRVFRLDPSRGHEVPEQHFPADASGVLTVDRYSSYKAMAQVKGGTLRLAFCWAHVRRDFVKVGKGWPELKDWALGWLARIRQLYRLNRERLGHAADSDAFRAADAQLRDHAERMRQQCEQELADNAIREPVRKTLESLREHWEGLTRFLDDPRIPMDNNASERIIRGPATGRKNYYGSGADWSGRLAAMLFSIFATLGHGRINPRAWLTWYLHACAAAPDQTPSDIGQFLPWNLSDERIAALNAHPPADLLDTS
jgi:transposase